MVSAVAVVGLFAASLPLVQADGSGNDTCATAEDFGGNGSKWGTLDLSGGDGKDFYRRWINTGDSIHVQMDPGTSGTEFHMVLYYPTCVIADFNYETGDNVEDIFFTATTSGYWYTEVWTQLGAGIYELSWTVVSEPPPCEPTQADPSTYLLVVSPDGRSFYIEDRGVLGDGVWVYEETNGLPGLQRGGIGLLGDDFPPGLPEIINGEDPINDETCGAGPDSIIVGIDPVL